MKLKIACLQIDISFGNPSENYQKAKVAIAKAMLNSPDIIVLPELWTTGYDLTRLEEIADDEGRQTVKFLQDEALKHEVSFIGGSVAARSGAEVKNTLLIIDKKGNLVHKYSKLHLFKLMDEHLYLKAGDQKGLFMLENKLFAGSICYDLRFPEWIRSHTAEGAEALFIVAEWPMPRLAHWRALLIARAIENQCYVIACNRSGADPANVFAGHSMIIDPWGEVIVEGTEREEVISAEIDLDQVKEIRNLIPIFTDRKPEFY